MLKRLRELQFIKVLIVRQVFAGRKPEGHPTGQFHLHIRTDPAIVVLRGSRCAAVPRGEQMLIVRPHGPHAIHPHAEVRPVVQKVPGAPAAGLSRAQTIRIDEAAATGCAAPPAAAFAADRFIVAQIELALEAIVEVVRDDIGYNAFKRGGPLVDAPAAVREKPSA